MNENLEDKIVEVSKRIIAGANPKKLLEEYASRLELHDAFFIVTQAQIRARKNK